MNSDNNNTTTGTTQRTFHNHHHHPESHVNRKGVRANEVVNNYYDQSPFPVQLVRPVSFQIRLELSF